MKRLQTILLLIFAFQAKLTGRNELFSLGVAIYYLLSELSSLSSVFFQNVHMRNEMLLLPVLLTILFIPLAFTKKFRSLIFGEKAPQAENSGKRKNKKELALLGKLTESEKKIYKLLCEGCSNQEIAAQLSITESTVKFHIRNILKKSGVKNRFELLASVHTRSENV